MMKELAYWFKQYSKRVNRLNVLIKARNSKRESKFRRENPNTIRFFRGEEKVEKTLIGFLEYLGDNYEEN